MVLEAMVELIGAVLSQFPRDDYSGTAHEALLLNSQFILPTDKWCQCGVHILGPRKMTYGHHFLYLSKNRTGMCCKK